MLSLDLLNKIKLRLLYYAAQAADDETATIPVKCLICTAVQAAENIDEAFSKFVNQCDAAQAVENLVNISAHPTIMSMPNRQLKMAEAFHKRLLFTFMPNRQLKITIRNNITMLLSVMPKRQLS